MNKKQKMFIGFLESLKTRNTSALIESVKQAYVLAECGNGCVNGECDTLDEGPDDWNEDEGLFEEPLLDEEETGGELDFEHNGRHPSRGIEADYESPDMSGRVSSAELDRMADEVLAQAGFGDSMSLDRGYIPRA